MRMESLNMVNARAASVCSGCLGKKKLGRLVCWRCYRFRKDITPYKFWTGRFEAWILLALTSGKTGGRFNE